MCGIHAVLTAIWQSGIIPTDWKRKLVATVLKLKGDCQDWLPTNCSCEFAASCWTCRDMSSLGSCLISKQVTVAYHSAYLWSADVSFDKCAYSRYPVISPTCFFDTSWSYLARRSIRPRHVVISLNITGGSFTSRLLIARTIGSSWFTYLLFVNCTFSWGCFVIGHSHKIQSVTGEVPNCQWF